MSARLLFVASTLSIAVGLASTAGCTVITNNDNDDRDGSTNNTSSSGNLGDAGSNADSGDSGEAGACLGSVERGPLCHADETPEPAAKCGRECDVASTAFSSDIALSIANCMDDALGEATATPEACEAAAGPCVAAATSQACASDVTDYCNNIATTCPTTDGGNGNFISTADCLQYMRGSTTRGKQLLLDCLEENKTDAKVCTICMDALKSVANGDE